MGSLHLQEDGYPQETYLQRYSKAQNFEGPWSHELSQAIQPQHVKTRLSFQTTSEVK